MDGTPTTGTTLNSLATGTFDGDESLISTGTGPYADSGNHYAVGIFQWASTTSTRDSFGVLMQEELMQSAVVMLVTVGQAKLIMMDPIVFQ